MNCDELGVHPGLRQRVVSDVVIYIGIRYEGSEPHDFELARQVTVCRDCGRVTDEQVIERERES